MYVCLGTVNSLQDLHALLERIAHCDKLEWGGYDDTNLHIYTPDGDEVAYIRPCWNDDESTDIDDVAVEQVNDYLERKYGSQIR